MTLEEYVLAGGDTHIYYGEALPADIPDGYEWKLFTFNGSPVCYKLMEKPRDCGCH
jgi:hypothetical protein